LEALRPVIWPLRDAGAYAVIIVALYGNKRHHDISDFYNMPLATWQAKRKAQTAADRSHDSDEDGSNDSYDDEPGHDRGEWRAAGVIAIGDAAIGFAIIPLSDLGSSLRLLTPVLSSSCILWQSARDGAC
jgi:hypothetical protein